jgi:hypothetical protein
MVHQNRNWDPMHAQLSLIDERAQLPIQTGAVAAVQIDEGVDEQPALSIHEAVGFFDCIDQFALCGLRLVLDTNRRGLRNVLAGLHSLDREIVALVVEQRTDQESLGTRRDPGDELLAVGADDRAGKPLRPFRQ